MRRRALLATPPLALALALALALEPRIRASGGIPRPLNGAAFGAFVADETRWMGALIAAAGIRAD